MGAKQDVIIVSTLQIVMLVLFAVFAKYEKHYDKDKYPLFQDVHVMIFIGFGFLMTFLKRYGYSAVGFNFLLGSLIIQWAIISQGFYNMIDGVIQIGIESLYQADIAAASVLISMGAVLGRSSYIQLLLMGIAEIALFSANSYLGSEKLKVEDVGGSIFVHAFGAYFGLAVSFVLNKRQTKLASTNELEEARYTSDLFAMIGTVFLWIFWPSFNAIEVKGDDQQRAIINTYLSLAACCVTAFAVSSIFTEEGKFDMVHIQNSTLAGGVAVGTSANLMVQPYGAILIGIVAGVLSVFGYSKLTPFLKGLGLPDTCGVHNLHGMPGVLAGIIGAIMASLATEDMYHESLYEIYPARANSNQTQNSEYGLLFAGEDRSAAQQAGYQLIGLVVTLAVAIVGGLLTGLILSSSIIKQVSPENHYDDGPSWLLPEAETRITEAKITHSTSTYDNPSFDNGLA